MKFKALPILLALAAIQFVLSSCYTVRAARPDQDRVGKTKVGESTGSVDFINIPQIKRYFSGELCSWKNQPCVISDNKIYRLKINELSSELLPLPPQLDTISHLEMSQDNRLIGISEKKEGATLFIEDKDKWKEIPLPSKFAKMTRKRETITVNGDIAFVISDGTAFLWDGKTWLDKSFPEGEDMYRKPSQVLIGNDGYIYFRCNLGEWGGGLGRFNLKTDDFEEISRGASVLDMAFDVSGKLWYIEEFVDEGALFTLDGKTPKCLYGMSQKQYLEKFSSGGFKNQEPQKTRDIFLCLKICEDGSVLLGDYYRGILKFKDGKMTRLTPDWNSGSYINSILPLENNEVCFTTSKQAVAVARNKKQSTKNVINTTANFVAAFKSLSLNASTNSETIFRKAEEDEHDGKLAQAAAEYLLSSTGPLSSGDSKCSDERFAKCEKIMNKLPADFTLAYMNVLTMAVMEDFLIQERGEDFQFRVRLCHKIQDLRKKLSLGEDKSISNMLLICTCNDINKDENLSKLFAEYEHGKKVDITKLLELKNELQINLLIGKESLRRAALLKILSYARRDTPENLNMKLVPILGELAEISSNIDDLSSARKYAEEATSIANQQNLWSTMPEKIKQDAFTGLGNIRGIGPSKLGVTEEKAILVALNLALTCDLNGKPSFRQPFGTMIGYYRWQNAPQKIKIETEKIIKDLKSKNKIDAAKALEVELKANEQLLH